MEFGTTRDDPPRSTAGLDPGSPQAPRPEALTGSIKIGLRRELRGKEDEKEAFQIQLSKTVAANSDGTFLISGLPPGRYELTPEFGPDVPYSAKPIQPQELRRAPPSRRWRYRWYVFRSSRGGLSTRRAEGELRESASGLTASSRRNSLTFGNQATTDGSGNYRVAVEPGTIIIQPDVPPITHMGMARESCPRFEVKADRTWPDLKLSPAAAIDGVVVDSSGKGVSGAEIHLVVPEVRGFFGETPPVLSQADGSYRLEHLDPDDRVPVRAETRVAASDGAIVIQTKEQKGQGQADRDDRSQIRFPRQGTRCGPARQASRESRRHTLGGRDGLSAKR